MPVYLTWLSLIALLLKRRWRFFYCGGASPARSPAAGSPRRAFRLAGEVVILTQTLSLAQTLTLALSLRERGLAASLGRPLHNPFPIEG